MSESRKLNCSQFTITRWAVSNEMQYGGGWRERTSEGQLIVRTSVFDVSYNYPGSCNRNKYYINGHRFHNFTLFLTRDWHFGIEEQYRMFSSKSSEDIFLGKRWDTNWSVDWSWHSPPPFCILSCATRGASCTYIRAIRWKIMHCVNIGASNVPDFVLTTMLLRFIKLFTY